MFWLIPVFVGFMVADDEREKRESEERRFRAEIARKEQQIAEKEVQLADVEVRYGRLSKQYLAIAAEMEILLQQQSGRAA